MSEQTARLVDQLRARLQRTTRRMTRAELAFGVAVAVGAAAGVWLLATLLEANLWLGTTARTALAATIATIAVVVGAAVLARPLGRTVGLVSGPTEEEVARAVGNHHPRVRDRLVNLLQLAEGQRSHAPPPLVDKAVRDLADDLEAVPFREVEDFGRARWAMRLASLPLVGVLAFILVAPSTFVGASERLLSPGTEFEQPAPFQLSVSPGTTRLTRGDSLQISIQATGAVPETVTLLLRDSTGAIDRVSLQSDSIGRFRHTVADVRAPLRYRVLATPLRTDWYRVAVTARPLVRQLQLTVQPPAYTGRPPRTLDANVGDVSALPGARVEVSATLGGPAVQTATLAFGSGRVDTLAIAGGTAEGAFTVDREATYRVRLRSVHGVVNRDPIRHRVTTRTDARPSISFLSPETPTDLQSDLTQPLRLRLSDDFGFRRMALFYRTTDADSGGFASVALPLDEPNRTSQTIAHTWLLAQESGLNPEPGDVVEYYVKVWDNDTVNGPKSGRTQTQRLRRPSLDDQYKRLDKAQQSADDQLDRLRRRADSVQQQFSRLRRELRRTREADWQDQRKLDRLRQQQASMRQGSRQLSRTLEQMTRQMQKNDLSSPETTQQYQDLQDVVDKMSSSKLREAFQQLRKALRQDDPRRMQKALERVQNRQQDYQQSLERTTELLKQLQAQQKLEEIAQRARNLSEEQKKIGRKTAERMADSVGTNSQPPASSDSSASDAQARPDSSDRDGSSPSRSSLSRPSSDSSAARPSATDSVRSPSRPRSSELGTQRTRSSSQPDSATGKRSPANEDLAQRQERAAQRMKELLKKMQAAERAMEDVPPAPKQKMRKMNQQLRQQNLPKQMRQNSRRLRQNQMQTARQGQRRMQRRLQQMQQRLQQMQSSMQGQQRSMNVSGLRTALKNTLRLSRQQEALRTDIEQLATEESALRRYARTQNALVGGLRTVTDSLQTIARRIPRMSRSVQERSGRALRAMESATTALDKRNVGQATEHQRSSMRHLNELALLLSDLLAKMQNQSQQGGGGGMSAQQMRQQLQQMAGQQQKLNRQIQQQLNQKRGERLSGSKSGRRKALARKQRQLRKKLQNLDAEAGSDVREQLLGDLGKIADQMETSAQELERDQRRREIMDRQRQILTRLLNAQQSLRTQGKKKERRGRATYGVVPKRSPSALPNTDEADALRRDLIRALDMGYSSDYESLIRRYFDLLREQSAADTSQSAPQ